jgi:hypothetical protein
MRVYLGSTADEVQEFLKELSLDVPDVYAPTDIFRSTHPEMDEEELEYSLSLLAAEDALDLADDKSGAPLVIAFEVAEEALGDFDEISAALLAPLHWSQVEAIFTVGESADDLTWFAPQEAAASIEEWLKG